MPQISEKELEDYIFKNYNKIEGLEGNFITRQLPLKGYGVVDLLIISLNKWTSDNKKYLTFKIIELKEDKIDLNSIGQISRYNTALKRNLKEIDYPLKDINEDLNIELFLIGHEIETDGDSCFLTDLLKEYSVVNIVTYNLDLENGLTFKNHKNDEWFDKEEKINYTLEKFIRKSFINSKMCQNTNK